MYLKTYYEKVRRQGSIRDVAVLNATGVNWLGQAGGDLESAGDSARQRSNGEGLCSSLRKRGLEGVQLIVSDDHSGLAC